MPYRVDAAVQGLIEVVEEGALVVVSQRYVGVDPVAILFQPADHRRVGGDLLDVGAKKPADHDTVDISGGVGGRDVDDHDPLSMVLQVLP